LVMAPPLLWRLVKEGRLEKVRAALAKGEDLNSRDEEGTTALMWAVLNKYNSIVRLLLEHPGIDVSCKGSKGHTALHISLFLAQATAHGYFQRKC